MRKLLHYYDFHNTSTPALKVCSKRARRRHWITKTFNFKIVYTDVLSVCKLTEPTLLPLFWRGERSRLPDNRLFVQPRLVLDFERVISFLVSHTGKWIHIIFCASKYPFRVLGKNIAFGYGLKIIIKLNRHNLFC